jgi:hypothetical protein
VYKTPTPPKEWVEETVRGIVRSSPGIVKTPLELLRRVREEARRNNYRPIIAPAQIQALLTRERD